MNRTFLKLPLCLLSLFIAMALSTAQSSRAETAINEVFAKQANAWNEGDIQTFMKSYWKSPDLEFLSGSGPVYGWQNTLERYLKRYPDRQAMGKLDFEIVKMDRRSAKVYSVIGKYHLTRTGLNNLEGYFLIIIRKMKGQWMIVADSTH